MLVSQDCQPAPRESSTGGAPATIVGRDAVAGSTEGLDSGADFGNHEITMRLPASDVMALRRKMPGPMFDAYRQLARAIWDDSTLDVPLREMLRLKSAELARCKL